MKKYSELQEGQILFLARQEEFWDYHTEAESNKADGILPKYTKVKVHFDDSPEILFKVMEGEFKNRIFMWGWHGSSNAQPEDLLTEEEYRQLNEPKSIWQERLNLVEQCPQRQDSLMDQMIDLHFIANKFGFYDAADFIRQTFIEKRMASIGDVIKIIGNCNDHSFEIGQHVKVVPWDEFDYEQDGEFGVEASDGKESWFVRHEDYQVIR